MLEQQHSLRADRTGLSSQKKKRWSEVPHEHDLRSQSQDRLTQILPALESVTAGSTLSRRGNAGLGPALSRLDIPEPVPDTQDPVQDRWEQGLEPVDDHTDSDNGE